MSILRSHALVLVALAVLLVVAACGGATTPGASGSAGTAASQPVASEPVPSEPADGGVTVSNPPLVAATYKTGKLHAEITGEVTKTIDAPLQGNFSLTSEGTTILSYADANGDGGGVILSAEVNGITISTTDVSTGGSNADANVCTVVVTQSDASKVAGTFDCKGVLGVVASGPNPRNVAVDVRGTFEASS